MTYNHDEMARPRPCSKCRTRMIQWRRQAVTRASAHKVLTEEQVQQLIDVADPRIKPAIKAMAWRGLRVGEIDELGPQARRRLITVSRLTLTRLYQKAAKAMGLEHVRLYDLRRYWLHSSRSRQ